MSAPLPVEFFVAKEPVDEPENVQELINTVGDCLGTQFSPPSSVILGQLNGGMPSKNVGPWFNQGQWWFWDPTVGSYVRGADGVPVGVIAIWGGEGAPPNWLVCDGSEISRTGYPALYQVMGEWWGSGDGVTTFNLPPGGVFYLSDGSFAADPSVPVQTVASSSWVPNKRVGWGVQGGSQLIPLLTPANMPALKVTVQFTNSPKTSGGSGSSSYLYPSQQSGANECVYQILDPNGRPLNSQGQTQISCMPPFAAANFIIKYQ